MQGVGKISFFFCNDMTDGGRSLSYDFKRIVLIVFDFGLVPDIFQMKKIGGETGLLLNLSKKTEPVVICPSRNSIN